MAETLKREEDTAHYYPDAPSGLSDKARALNLDALWMRVEAHIAWRWTPRDVVWTVQGPGQWAPCLAPCDLTGVELWEGAAWVEAFPAASPLGGYDLGANAIYRITGTVGDNLDPPEDAIEAVARLAEYLAQADEIPRGATKAEATFGELSKSVERSQAWMARALDLSGASDLLRRYRRV